MRIALAANGRMGLGLLRALLRSDHQVVALVRDGRTLSVPLRWVDHAAGMAAGPWSVEGRALAAGVRSVWLRDQDASEAARLRRREPDLLIVGNFGMILKKPILDVPSIGAVNAHWSLLPHHRGPHPSTSVLMAGETETGLSFHVVNERIDAGAILDQSAFPIGPTDTATSLYLKACAAAERRIVDVVDRIERDGLVGEAQDLSAGSYFKRVTPEGATLDFSRSAEDLDRMCRALVQPMPRFLWRGRTVYVSRAHRVAGVHGEPGTLLSTRPNLVIACGEGGLAIGSAWTSWPPGPWPPVWGGVRVGDRADGHAKPPEDGPDSLAREGLSTAGAEHGEE